ncbi:PAS domain S-box protein [Pseudomonas sp. CBS]|uniref:hybrid sensor histidine kinase/response regulator n=1 Tax=Pseudomonas TaxID=286 RepID=UPI0021AC8004|nr:MULTISPECIES: PAS domain-containing sensor histidine kinase [unclassified Pseudomonas]UVH52023.1 PAS domain S-box protein [Pseudomonas sp. CBS]WEL64426.1 PAS domain S-box protein [Pseudomonas sp. CBSPGW29]WEL89355.1 PAS domain S-box protein [Pseudomonas sp. CBSPCBW29]
MPSQPAQGSFNQDDRYRLLVDAVVDYAIYMLDTNGLIRSWNSGAKKIKQYEQSEVLGRHFSLFYTPEDLASDLPGRALKSAEQSGRFEGEGWRIRTDGTRLWALVIIDPIRADDGTLIGFAKVTRDLTERKAAEEALRQSEQQFSLLVQGVTDYALYMLDPNGVITTWNAGAQRIKGYEPAEVIGKHYSLFFQREDADNKVPQRALETVIREGRYEGQGWRLRKDGTGFLAHVVIDPIKNEQGELVGFAKITRDVTESVQAQQEIKETREALFQAQKMESLGQLTGGIAHDFNNLLMVILGSLELAKKRVPQDSRTYSLLNNAIAGAQRGATLTQRMLAFARRQELDPQPVDVGDLIRNMSDLLSRMLGAGISVDTQFPLILRPVLVDMSQLEMAVMNLVINARDAMEGRGRILISAREDSFPGRPDDSERLICIAVIDTGPGMNDATLQRAMEPFFTTKGAGKGTGLGLSMVHGLAAQSHGHFVLKSKEGEGTTAELWLPVAVMDTTQSAAMASTANPADAPHQQNLEILLVDDDPLVLISTGAMLEDLGHHVVAAADGHAALAFLAQGTRFDLVITDMAMPDMTGIELAGNIEALYPELPIILSSGFAEISLDLKTTLTRLPKPFDQSALAKVIAETLRTRIEKPC